MTLDVKAAVRIMVAFGCGPYRTAYLFGLNESTVRYWTCPKWRDAQRARDKRRRDARRGSK